MIACSLLQRWPRWTKPDRSDAVATSRAKSAARARSPKPWWPERRTARKGAPNIVDRLHGRHGLVRSRLLRLGDRYTEYRCAGRRGVRLTHYTTHAICSPARAALLTGCNAHGVGTGWLANNHPGYPGYSGEIPLEAATLAETLRAAGYETIMVGKWHNTPAVDNVPAAPSTIGRRSAASTPTTASWTARPTTFFRPG